MFLSHDNDTLESFTAREWTISTCGAAVMFHNRLPGGHGYPSELSAKKQSKWSPDEDAMIIALRGIGMKWEDIIKQLPGRSAISCRLHYQNYLERQSLSDEDRKEKFERLCERFKGDPWLRVAEEMTLPQRAGEPIKEGTSTWSYLEKYGVKPSAGGGRSKAREIIGRVAAGTVVRKYLSLLQGVEDDVLETESARNLPPDIAEESPTYVSAEQFHGILKRHVARQKLEADDVDIGKSPQIPSRRGPGRGQRRNNAYWRSQQGNADFNPFERECLFADSDGGLNVPARAQMDSRSNSSFRISMRYLTALGKEHEISSNFEAPDGNDASIIGIVRNLPFRVKGTSVTFRQDFLVTLEDVADIVFGWRFMTSQFDLLFGRIINTTSRIGNAVSALPGKFTDIATKAQSQVSDFMGSSSLIPPPPYSLYSVFAPDFSGGPNML